MSVVVVSRSTWGAKRPKMPVMPVPLSSRMATCVHHDGAYPLHITTFEQACALMRKDQDQHMVKNDWNDIGYNFLVISAPGFPVDGTVFEGRGRDVLGAHCKDWNTPWVGVQISVGGGQQPSEKALRSVRALHEEIATAAGRSLAVKGHRDGFATLCPDAFLYAWLKAGMPLVAAVPTKAVVAVVSTVKAALKAPAKAIARIYGQLVVDGDFGAATRKALQRWAKVAQDGVMGPVSWKAVQHRLGLGVDGVPGPLTWKAIQRMVGAKADGLPGQLTIKALQRYLNSH